MLNPLVLVYFLPFRQIHVIYLSAFSCARLGLWNISVDLRAFLLVSGKVPHRGAYLLCPSLTDPPSAASSLCSKPVIGTRLCSRTMYRVCSSIFASLMESCATIIALAVHVPPQRSVL
jgi:hypothetical protein